MRELSGASMIRMKLSRILFVKLYSFGLDRLRFVENIQIVTSNQPS